MQKLLYVIICIVLLNGLVLAQSFDLQIVEETNDGFVGGNFDIRIQIRSVGSTFGMGTSNLVFSFNTNGLTGPTLQAVYNFSGQNFPPNPEPWYNYDPLAIEVPIAGFVSINIVEAGLARTVEANWMDVATIRFEITDTGQMSGNFWRTIFPNPTNVFDENSVSIPSNNLGGLDVSLPVELSSFTANVSEDLDVKLEWITQTEVNNQGFEVFRSSQKEGTYDILSSYTSNNDLIGQGNSSSKHTYKFTDKTVLKSNVYWYKISDVDYNGVRTHHGPISINVEAGETDDGGFNNNLPDKFELSQNFPNPFNPETRIEVSIPDQQNIGEISINVYDIMGQKVKSLFTGKLDPGIHNLRWDGTNEIGKQVSGGTYFYYLKSNKFHQIKKMIFMK